MRDGHSTWQDALPTYVQQHGSHATMLVIVYPRNVEDPVLEALRLAEVEGYTVSNGWHGIGNSGPVLGSTTWPGENAVILTAVSQEQSVRLVDMIRAIHDQRRAVLPGTGMSIFAFPCTQLL